MGGVVNRRTHSLVIDVVMAIDDALAPPLRPPPARMGDVRNGGHDNASYRHTDSADDDNDYSVGPTS